MDRFEDCSWRPIIVASDRVDVQHSAAKMPWVEKVCFIEQMESVFAVADEVLRILDIVNQWLVSLTDDGDGVPEELLFFERHAEGGMTTQRIQDALLLIRSYRCLFEENNVYRVVIRRHINHQWEDDVLVQTAHSYGIEVEEHRSMGYRIGEKLGLRSISRRLLGRYPLYFPRCLSYSIQSWIRPGIDVVRAKLNPRNRCLVTGETPEITVLLGSSADKHVENIVPLMKEFQHREGFTPLALCWQAADGAAKVRRAGLMADELEAWFPLVRFAEVLWCVRKTWKRASVRRDELKDHSALTYEGVSLTSLLQPSVEYLLRFQMIRRMILKVAAERYFEKHMPVAMKAWGDNTLELGAICLGIAQNVSCTPPLIFFYYLGSASVPYAEHKSDLYLAASEIDKRRLVSEGADPETVVVVGQSRYDHLNSFRQKYSKQDSQDLLGLPSHNELCVFYAPAYPIRGDITWRECFAVAKALIDFFDESSHGLLIIKPHPSDSSDVLNVLKKQYISSGSVFWYDKDVLPYHHINAADVVITKFSTIGLEAMLLGTPLISIALDGERRFQDIFGDADEKFTDLESMLSFLRSIATDPAARTAWEERQRRLQQQFLAQRFAYVEGRAAESMAQTVLDRIKLRSRDSVAS